MGEETSIGKEGLSKSLRKYLPVGILVLVIFICAFLVYFSFAYEPKINYVCGDGTPYDECSENRPYFCRENVLIENAMACGCSPNLIAEGDFCISNYFLGESSFDFKYFLNGKEGYVPFTLYEGILNYTLKLPRYLSYEKGQEPVRADFKLMKLNEPVQVEALIPLVVEIQNLVPWSKDEQAQIAISLVQNIPYGEPDSVAVFMDIGRSRLPRQIYQILYENVASCEGKSELLAFLLRELGFEVVLFYYQVENHEAVGIKCPVEYSLDNTGYCFIETTLAGPISYSEGRYLGPGGSSKLGNYTEMTKISEGEGLGKNLDDYKDAKDLRRLVDKVDEKGYLNYFEKKSLDALREKYNLIY